MTEPKSHTPGPWKWRKGFLYGGEYNQIVSPTIYEDLHCDNPVDAYLIAAGKTGGVHLSHIEVCHG